MFESETLDDRNWVMDFGGLKAFKEWSEHMFDHTLVIAKDDPHLEMFLKMADLGLQAEGGTLTTELTSVIKNPAAFGVLYNFTAAAAG